jgi:uncharacterized MAPEG superfamily protein
MMTPAYQALLGYALWTLLLLVCIVSYRGVLVLFAGKAIDSFPADEEPTGPDWSRRLIRAHLNCVENLPVAAVVILVAANTGHMDQANLLAPWVLVARVTQTSLHLLTVRPFVIWFRVTALMAQVGLLAALALPILLG